MKKWLSVGILFIILVVAFWLFHGNASEARYKSPAEVAGAFIMAAQNGDRVGLVELCEPAMRDEAHQVARQLEGMTIQHPLSWQPERPQVGNDSVAAMLVGSGKRLTIEVTQDRKKRYHICRLELIDY